RRGRAQPNFYAPRIERMSKVLDQRPISLKNPKLHLAADIAKAFLLLGQRLGADALRISRIEALHKRHRQAARIGERPAELMTAQIFGEADVVPTKPRQAAHDLV